MASSRITFVSSALFFCLASAATAQFTQQGSKLVATDATGAAQQGWSVALSADGNTALLGGPNDNGAGGAAWVFTRSGGVWAQQGNKLVGTDGSANANQGISVALSADGNTALIGGGHDNNNQGAAWVFTRSGSVWSQQGPKLVGSGSVGSPQQGSSVALSADGDTALLGGFADNSGAGAVWVFTRTGSVWTQQGSKLVGTGGIGAQQGWSVALSADGNTALVGGDTDNSGAGAAWVFRRMGGIWTQPGPKLVGSGASGPALQGSSVALSGDGNTALLGGPHDSNFFGSVWVFAQSGGAWSQQGPKLVANGAGPDALQGQSVALSGDGNTALIGGPGSPLLDAAWEFTRSAGSWSQVGGTLVGTGASGAAAQQGFSVALSSDAETALVGGPMDSGGIGATWVFVAPKLGNILLFANSVVGLGESERLPLILSAPAPPSGLTLLLTSSDPSNVTVTPSVFIPGGWIVPREMPVVNGLDLGSSTITVTAPGFSPESQLVRVMAIMAFARCCVTITGPPLTAVLNLSGPAPSGGLTITLSSDNPAIATVPATITFPAGATSVNVPITGVAVGNTVIHAHGMTDLLGSNIRVTVRAVTTNPGSGPPPLE